jgi:sugar lactone lactonase YvrE
LLEQLLDASEELGAVDAVDGEGRAYITHFGYDLFVNEAPRKTGVIVRHPGDGTLANQRVIREFGPTKTHVVDGICVDVEDGVWISACYQGQYHRVLPDGTITDTITIPPDGGNYVVDSALGGPDMRTLFMLIADADPDRINDDFATTARIETVEVDVPGLALD